MSISTRKIAFLVGIAAAASILNVHFSPAGLSMIATAEAVVGAPATPVSYAGVARRSTVGAGAPGVGVTPGVGVGAPGVGVTPGVNTPTNVGGPVNRVGVR
jgi:hypothetical protein